MADKVTTMVVKVDLQCSSCRKKIKKLLSKFPEIQNQIYDEKQNTVTITVICCSPEKIRDKLCCKGGKVIKSIEIKEPPKPKEPEKKKETEKPKEPEKKKEPEKPKEPEKKKEPEKPKEPEKKKEPEKPKEPEKKKEPEKEPEKPKDKPKEVLPVVPVGIPPGYPFGTCCGPCYEGYGGGPCYHGYGRPVPCYEQYGYYGYGYGYGCSCGCGGRSYCRYFAEENPQACTIM